jgi:hypothetical protein
MSSTLVVAAGHGAKVLGKSRLTIRIVQRGDKFPKNCFRIRLFPDGILRDIDGHRINDAHLPEIMRRKGIDNPNDRLFLIKIDDEENTSIATLNKLLKEMRAFADPKRQTNVYIYLRNTSSKK